MNLNIFIIVHLYFSAITVQYFSTIDFPLIFCLSLIFILRSYSLSSYKYLSWLPLFASKSSCLWNTNQPAKIVVLNYEPLINLCVGCVHLLRITVTSALQPWHQVVVLEVCNDGDATLRKHPPPSFSRGSLPIRLPLRPFSKSLQPTTTSAMQTQLQIYKLHFFLLCMYVVVFCKLFLNKVN